MGKREEKCFPESTERLQDNVMPLISMKLFEEVATRKDLTEIGKDIWMLSARESSRLVRQHKSAFVNWQMH